MVQEETATAEEPQEAIPEATPPGESSEVEFHIRMPTEMYEQAKKYARYAVLEGLIEGHPRGNMNDYCNFCFTLGEQHIKQYMLKKRGYK